MEYSPTHRISQSETDDIVRSLNDFEQWLLEKKVITKKSTVKYVELPFADADWTMLVDGDNVSFNINVRQKCSPGYYKSIVLHEFFHLAVQKVPHKDDAIKIKDDFGGELMKLIDIEADYFTARFYKENLGYNLVSYLKLYYEGGKVFADKWIRISKLERYIGTLLSITKMFLDYPGKKEATTCDLYLPCIVPLSTDEKIHALVIRKEHIYLDYIDASPTDFINIKNCYASLATLTFKQYCQKIVDFCCHSLNRPIPKNIQNKIDALKD